uniref:Zinc knuckle domain-like n=1 Tax=Oryza sativa subsp. japonica TaxID=39947 RepID=Q5Z4I9_ORYSJ|nr:zinc knuckle domain-like [Oryza sativa Japonica Group]BAD62343.1 zinc knuckle domain-like [Oryza sativa Japonica Group]
MAAAGDHRGAGAPPPVGRADEAAFGRAPRLPGGARPSAARALGAADAWDPRRRPASAACARSTVDREADAWAPLPWTRSARPSPRLTQ